MSEFKTGDQVVCKEDCVPNCLPGHKETVEQVRPGGWVWIRLDHDGRLYSMRPGDIARLKDGETA